jgi:murein DD-endopeptidase MepM/ murein hydrolase activator NlpD
LPDPQRPRRRLTDTRLLTRAVAHLIVIGMVVSAVAVGIAQAAGQTGTERNGLFDFVSTARGADEAAATPRTLAFNLAPDAVASGPTIDRGAPAQTGPQTEPPLPTPVAVDPNATPLPGPQIGAVVGQSTRGSGSAATAPIAPSGGPLAWPVPGGSVSQYFSSAHLAIDIAASYGTQVVAAQAGTVVSAGWRNNGGGWVIQIDHGNGMTTLYNHLGSIWVTAGQAVAKGEGIAGVGCSGLCTGPHVHFEVIVGGVISNPMRYL